MDPCLISLWLQARMPPAVARLKLGRLAARIFPSPSFWLILETCVAMVMVQWGFCGSLLIQSFAGLPFKLNFFNPHLNWDSRCAWNRDPQRRSSPMGCSFKKTGKSRVDAGMPLVYNGQDSSWKLPCLRECGCRLVEVIFREPGEKRGPRASPT